MIKLCKNPRIYYINKINYLGRDGQKVWATELTEPNLRFLNCEKIDWFKVEKTDKYKIFKLKKLKKLNRTKLHLNPISVWFDLLFLIS